MASFETVVRPVVFPDIRPSQGRTVPPKADDPKQGICEITGSSGKAIDLPYSWSVSSSESRPTESRRRVDVARVYQKEDDGTVDRDNFVDINVANKIWMRDGPIDTVNYYTRVQEDDNIEIRERNKIITNPGS
jgi:hypothetical protein